jgi:putative SOS response-associated peptidase YedK
MGLAGLWETWTDRVTGAVVTTCTVITCLPNELRAELHDRMPVILDPVAVIATPAVARAGRRSPAAS